MLSAILKWSKSSYSPITLTPTSITISGRAYFLVAGVVMELLIFLNLLWSCSRTFDCRSFWPTISYLGCYKGHDRVYNLSAGLYSFVLMSFFLSASLNYRPYLNQALNRFMLLLGVGISMLFPAVTIIDEANSSYYVQTELVHYILMKILLTLGFSWVFFSVMVIGRIKLEPAEEEWNSFLKKYILLGVAMACLSIYEWNNANLDPKTWWMNENVEALTEWFAVTLCIFAPFFYSMTFPSCSLSLSSHHSNIEDE